jgi:hypothetical protein
MKHDYIALQKYCEKNNIELLKDYSNEKITRETKIEGKCKGNNCNDNFCKLFKNIILLINEFYVVKF